MKMNLNLIKKRVSVFILCVVFVLAPGMILKAQNATSNKERAIQYFKSVYIEDTPLSEELISKNIVATYPVYQEIFNKAGLSGKEEIINFSNGFKQRWKERDVNFRDVIAEKDKVVVIWSFSAKRTPDNSTNINNTEKTNWGGITVIYFDKSGKISAEYGLENEPGPYELLQQTKKLN
jgi:predicted SnoaL-like aldol condensation-catalyzing enzyme